MNKDSIINKILITLAGLIFLIGFIWIIKLQYDAKNKQEALDQAIIEMRQLKDNIARSQAQYVDKDTLDKFSKDIGFKLEDIQDDLHKLNADVAAINNISIVTPGGHFTNMPSSSSNNNAPIQLPNILPCQDNVCINPDKFGYLNSSQTLQLHEPFNQQLTVPFGSVSFEAWQKQPWSLNILPRNYSVTTVIAQDDNGRHFAYNKFSIIVDNKTYDVPIKTAKLVEQIPEAKWHWWNPRLFLTTGGSVKVTHVPPIQGDVNLGLTFGFLDYGKFRNSPDISVLQMGLGYQFIDKSPSVIINPVMFNFGRIIPGNFISNSYIGPSVQIDIKGNVMPGINLGFGL